MRDRFTGSERVAAFRIRCSLLLAAVLIAAVPVSAVRGIEMEPRTLEQTAREASAILDVTLLKQESRYGDGELKRFIYTTSTFRLEDPVFAERAFKKREEVKVTTRGGTIERETQEIAGLPRLTIGTRYVLMLRPNWAEIKGVPTVGGRAGVFRVVPNPETKSLVVVDSLGAPVVLGPKGLARIPAGSAEGTHLEEAVTLAAFTAVLRKEVPRLKKAAPDRPKEAKKLHPQAMKTYSRPDDPKVTAGKPDPESKAAAKGRAAAGPESPAKPSKQPAGSGKAVRLRDPRPKDLLFAPRFALDGAADLPIVINQFPSTFTPWSPEDQHQMSSWNHYASEVFRVRTTPTTDWSYGNGVFDLAGWPASDIMKRQFGSTWADLDDAFAVCFSRKNGNKIIEADIALNPAYSWTLDDEAVYDGSNLKSFRRTMTHELGHAWGLDHQFNFLSVMNYPPAAYRPFPLPFMDDAEGLRRNYPARKVETTDLGIHLFHSAGAQDWRQATFPASVAAGANLSVTNYHLENVGTRSVASPAVEWYLTPARNFTGTNHYLGTTTYPKLETFAYFTPSTVSRTLAVPASVPAGSYHLAAFIRGDESLGTNGFQGNNSRSFSRTKITVTRP